MKRKMPTCPKHPHVVLTCGACAAEAREHYRGGRPPIEDEFSDLPISRQRKYQLRKEKELAAKPRRKTPKAT